MKRPWNILLCDAMSKACREFSRSSIFLIICSKIWIRIEIRGILIGKSLVNYELIVFLVS